MVTEHLQRASVVSQVCCESRLLWSLTVRCQEMQIELGNPVAPRHDVARAVEVHECNRKHRARYLYLLLKLIHTSVFLDTSLYWSGLTNEPGRKLQISTSRSHYMILTRKRISTSIRTVMPKPKEGRERTLVTLLKKIMSRTCDARLKYLWYRVLILCYCSICIYSLHN